MILRVFPAINIHILSNTVNIILVKSSSLNSSGLYGLDQVDVGVNDHILAQNETNSNPKIHPNENTKNQNSAKRGPKNTHKFISVEQNTHDMRLFVLDEYPNEFVSSIGKGNGAILPHNEQKSNILNALKNTNTANNDNNSLNRHIGQISEIVQWLIDIVPTTDRAGLLLTG